MWPSIEQVFDAEFERTGELVGHFLSVCGFMAAEVSTEPSNALVWFHKLLVVEPFHFNFFPHALHEASPALRSPSKYFQIDKNLG